MAGQTRGSDVGGGGSIRRGSSADIVARCDPAVPSSRVAGPDVAVAGSGREFDDKGRLTSAQYTKTLTALMTKLRVEISR